MTIEGLRTRGWIGLQHSKCVAFPISDHNGEVYRAHCRNPKRNSAGKWEWFYEPMADPQARPITALVFGNFDTANRIYPFESQWDAISLIDKLELFEEIDAGEVCLICTRGAKGYSRLRKFRWPRPAGASVYAFAQNDDAGRDWLDHVIEITRGAYAVATPAAYNDLGQWCKDGQATAYDVEAAMDTAELRKPAAADAVTNAKEREPYKPKGNSPAVYFKKAIEQSDILIGNGFLERDSAILIVGSSGIGKSSIGMQMGCCWSCGASAFDLDVTRELRIVMMQHEDSVNDLIRMSQVLHWCGLDPEKVKENFWIETVRGKIGPDAVGLMRELVQWWKADLLLLNPLSAYHDGDISRNEDNIRFLYGDIGALLSEFHIGLAALHHDTKPPRSGNGKNNASENYHDAKYAVLGGSVLTNFFRGIITINAIPNSSVFRFTLAKRFEESGWPLHSMFYKWHEDRSRRLWVPASLVESTEAKKNSGKTLDELRKLVPVSGSIPKATLEMDATKGSGFSRREYEGLLAQALDDCTPDDLRLYQWSIYNPEGFPKAAISRFEQPPDETHRAIKEAKAKERKTTAKVAQTGSETSKK